MIKEIESLRNGVERVALLDEDSCDGALESRIGKNLSKRH